MTDDEFAFKTMKEKFMSWAETQREGKEVVSLALMNGARPVRGESLVPLLCGK